MSTEHLKVAIVRPGRFGTALAVPISENAEAILCFASFEPRRSFEITRVNQKYHPEIVLPKDVKSTHNTREGVMDSDIVLLTVPMKHLRSTCRSLKPYGLEEKIVASGIKGIEAGTSYRPSEVILDVNPRLSRNSFAAISGPNLARELIRKLPAVTVIASEDTALTHKLQGIFRTSYLFPYLSNDVIGVELGGALKNPIAMIVGICDGLGLGNNAAAAIKNRGWREVVRLAVMLEADERTLMGVAGEGDLSTSCQPGGRNYDAGVAIGRGEDPRVLQKSEQTIEAFNTIGPVLTLAKRLNVDVPILEGLNRIIQRERQPSYVVNMLVEGNGHYEDPEPVIHRGAVKLIVRKLNRFLHLWRNAR